MNAAIAWATLCLLAAIAMWLVVGAIVLARVLWNVLGDRLAAGRVAQLNRARGRQYDNKGEV